VLEDVYRETDQASLIEWRLKQEHEQNDLFWIYKLKLESQLATYEVKIDASSGEFLEFEVED